MHAQFDLIYLSTHASFKKTAMEAEYHKLKAIPSFKYKIDTTTAAAISRSGSESDEIPRFQKLRAVSSFKHLIESPAPISREGSSTEIDELPRYQSLKDVMAASVSPRAGGEIAIRNELVKHAASAYVLSATIISPANRDEDSRIFERIKICCLGFVSCWQIHVGLPFEALCWPLVDFVYQIVHRVRNGLRGGGW